MSVSRFSLFSLGSLAVSAIPSFAEAVVEAATKSALQAAIDAENKAIVDNVTQFASTVVLALGVTVVLEVIWYQFTGDVIPFPEHLLGRAPEAERPQDQGNRNAGRGLGFMRDQGYRKDDGGLGLTDSLMEIGRKLAH